jgi:beta-galactosidase
VRTQWDLPMAGQSRLWAERLRPLNDRTEVVATYGESNGWLDGRPAVTRCPVGEKGGQVLYVGAWLNAELQESLTDWLLNLAQVTSVSPNAPSGVEVANRIGPDGRRVQIVINHLRIATELKLSAPQRDVLTGESFVERVPLEPYGVRVLIGAETDAPEA